MYIPAEENTSKLLTCQLFDLIECTNSCHCIKDSVLVAGHCSSEILCSSEDDDSMLRVLRFLLLDDNSGDLTKRAKVLHDLVLGDLCFSCRQVLHQETFAEVVRRQQRANRLLHFLHVHPTAWSNTDICKYIVVLQLLAAQTTTEPTH